MATKARGLVGASSSVSCLLSLSHQRGFYARPQQGSKLRAAPETLPHELLPQLPVLTSHLRVTDAITPLAFFLNRLESPCLFSEEEDVRPCVRGGVLASTPLMRRSWCPYVSTPGRVSGGCRALEALL